MTQTEQLLQQFLFSEQESKIYLAALSLKKAGITSIAKKAGFSRANTYFHIKKLVDRKILKESKKGKKVLISPTPPAELGKQFTRYATAFQDIVPSLNALHKIEDETPQIDILESREDFYRVYDDITNLPEDSTIRVLENTAAITSEIELLNYDRIEKFFRKIIKKGIFTKGLISKEALRTSKKKMDAADLWELQSKRMWDIRNIDESTLTGSVLVFIYENKTAFITPDSTLTVIITSKNITQIIQNLFDLVFNLSPKTNIQNWKST